MTVMENIEIARRDKPLAGRKILIIVENLPLPFDRRVWHECLTLTAAGALVSVICPVGRGYNDPYEELEGVHIYRHTLPLEAKGAVGYLAEYGAALWHELRLSLKVLRRHGFDTIQGCNPPDLIFLVALPFKIFGKRYIFDHHDINPELYEAKFGKRGFFWRLMVLFERLTFMSADVVISTNNSYRKIAMTRGKKKSEDVFVVRSGPDLNRLRFPAPDAKWRNGRKHLIGYVGVMGEQEGLDLLLEAARIVVFENNYDVQFVLVGGGTALEETRALADELGLSDHVTLTGRAPDDDLFSVLASSDLCVNPDRVNPMNDQSTMNKILEYMAFSKPVVQFEVTEGRYSAGEASLYAAPNDAHDMAAKIITLLDDPEERDRMGRLGRKRIEDDLNWDQQVKPLIAAYERAAEKR